MNGVSWLQVTPQRAQLLFGENIFTFSSLHVLLSVLIYCIIQLSLLVVFGAAPHYAGFRLSAVGCSRAQGPQEGQICLHGSLYSVNLLVLVPG